jgi:acyl dehydratase
MARRTLSSPPGILALYARSGAAMIPGASLLGFLPGGGGEIPELELELAGVRTEPDALAAYAKVCGFALRGQLPATYPHVLAFPLHMAVMADGDFPFGAVGLVHIENRILQHRPILLGEELSLLVRPTALREHPRGRTFTLLTEARVDGQKVWESTSTMLRRGGQGSAPAPSSGSQNGFDRESPAGEADSVASPGSDPDLAANLGSDSGPAASIWRLGGDLGRRYAAVSGDRNPIHMHSLTAKPFGFPGAIAHGMWTKARALAALESRLPDSFGVEVSFRKPIVLPASVEFESHQEGSEIEFAIRDAKRHVPHLNGRIWTIDAASRDGAAKPKTAGVIPQTGTTEPKSTTAGEAQ